MDQKFIIERFTTDLVCSLGFLVSSLTDVSFIIVPYGEYAFWAAGGFFAAIPLGKIGSKAEQRCHIHVLLYIHGSKPQRFTVHSFWQQLWILNLFISHFGP